MCAKDRYLDNNILSFCFKFFSCDSISHFHNQLQKQICTENERSPSWHEGRHYHFQPPCDAHYQYPELAFLSKKPNDFEENPPNFWKFTVCSCPVKTCQPDALLEVPHLGWWLRHHSHVLATHPRVTPSRSFNRGKRKLADASQVRAWLPRYFHTHKCPPKPPSSWKKGPKNAHSAHFTPIAKMGQKPFFHLCWWKIQTNSHAEEFPLANIGRLFW